MVDGPFCTTGVFSNMERYIVIWFMSVRMCNKVIVSPLHGYSMMTNNCQTTRIWPLSVSILCDK